MSQLYVLFLQTIVPEVDRERAEAELKHDGAVSSVN